VSLIYIST